MSKLLESIALPTKDNVIKDNHGKWSIEETCDNVKLESFHPLLPGGEKNFLASELFIFTHECDKNQIVYFKVDLNLIGKLPESYLGQFAISQYSKATFVID